MALPDIKEHTIIEAMKTRFAAITSGANYYTTFDKVVDNMPGNHSYDKDLTKIINIRETNDTLLEEQESSSVLHDIGLDIDIDVIAKGSAVADIRKMKADILKSINTDLTWSGNAFYTIYRGSQRNKTDQYGNKIADLTISITVQYRKNAWSSS